jgi:uncharacterized protein with FMN-binding domain
MNAAVLAAVPSAIPEPAAPSKPALVAVAATPKIAVSGTVPASKPAPAEIAAPPDLAVAPSVSDTPAPLAPAPTLPTLPPVPAPVVPKWKDGTFTGWGYSRHGDIQASVVIEGGRITSATISECRTRYSCSVIDKLPPQVVQRQSPEVDYVSRATQSADAFYGAVVAALNKAK